LNKRRRLSSVIGPLTYHANCRELSRTVENCRELAQLSVNKWKQLIRGLLIARYDHRQIKSSPDKIIVKYADDIGQGTQPTD